MLIKLCSMAYKSMCKELSCCEDIDTVEFNNLFKYNCKNESHIITKTLNNLCSYINFSYWVICDTGSIDNTK